MDEVREGAILRQSTHATSSTWRILCALRWGYLSGLEPAELLPLKIFGRCSKLVDDMFVGQKRTYEEFKRQIPPQLFSAFDSLRQYCVSLGANVVEDVRAHRIVFGKSLSFRWFADLEPDQDKIIIKIQKSRKEPFATSLIRPDDNLDEVKSAILEAYNTIR